jgi:peptidoglycan/LPS O-acetylase OafA/YrhL
MELPNAMTWGWSLCVEEHFYLLLPAFLALVFRFLKGGARGLVLVPFAIAPLLFRWAWYVKHPDESGFYWLHPLSHTHGEGLAIGVLIAYTYVFHHASVLRGVRRLGPLTWILGVAFVGMAMRWGGLRTPGYFPVVWQYFFVAVGSALVLLNGLYLDNGFTRFLAWRGWIPLARMSYCTYLIQMYVIFFMLAWWPRGLHGTTGAVVSFFGFSAACMLLSSVFAGLIYLLLERPMLDKGGELARRVLPRPKVVEAAPARG